MSDFTANAEKLAMYFEEPRDFMKSLKTIEKMQQALTCNSCKKLMQNPITLWSCSHVYCRHCAYAFEHCPVCSLPAWKEDQCENKAVTVILETTNALQKLLQGYMNLTKKAEVSDSAVTFPEDTPCKEIPLPISNSAIAKISEQITPAPLPEEKKSKTTTATNPQKGVKFRVAPSRPFPELTDDSEEMLIPDDPTDPFDAANEASSKPDGIKMPEKEFATFATPSPPKRRRNSDRTPLTPKNPTTRGSAQNTRTPKNRLRTPIKSPGVAKTPIKSPGAAKTPKTPKSAKKNKKGETPLHIAAMKGKVEEVKSLLEAGIDINAADNAGWTPLHEACNRGHLEVVEQLLDAGALINVPGYEDETPLIDASRQGYVDIVKFLLDRGADVSLRTANGVTAADFAASDELKQIFEDHIFLTQAALTDFNADDFNDSAPENIVIMSHNTLNMSKISQVVEMLKATLSLSNVASATHYVTTSYEDGRSPRNAKYLQAVARGIWIIKTDWLEACKTKGGWVRELDFEISGSRNDLIDGGPKRSRMNKAAKRPPIFHGCHFFLYGNFKPPTLSKSSIVELLQLAGGTILSREPKPDSDSVQTCTKVPYHAHKDTPQFFYTYYIVYNAENGTKPSRVVRRGKVCTVPLSWVLDCISQFYLCEIPDSF